MTRQSSDPQGALALRRASCVTPVRVALRRLETGGGERDTAAPAAPVTDADLESVEGTYIARMLIEPYAVQRASLRISRREADKLATLAGRIADARAEGNSARASIANYDFHFALYNAARSRWLIRLITPLWESSERYRLAVGAVHRSLDERRREHERILEACVRRAPELAAFELHNHLALTANVQSRKMGGEELFAIQEPAAGPA